MTLFRKILLGGLALGASAAAAQAQPADAAKPAMVTLQMPATPAPVAVKLNPKTTAILMLDMVQPICGVQPKCMTGMLPAATSFLAQARKAGVTVAYGTNEKNDTQWLAPVAPMAGDIKVLPTAQDRFYNTDLDKQLQAKGITTIIQIGWKASGSQVYTSVGATAHGFTVVIPVDTTAAPTDYETAIGYFQILNQLLSNPTNTPLKPKTSTLSRTDLISFQ